MGRTRKYSLRPTFKTTNFESMLNWEKICLNLSFNVENKIENLHKAGHVSNVSLNFKNSLVKWDKYIFYCKKWNFEVTISSAHTTEDFV